MRNDSTTVLVNMVFLIKKCFFTAAYQYVIHIDCNY